MSAPLDAGAILRPGIVGIGYYRADGWFMSGMAGNVSAFSPSGPTTFTAHYSKESRRCAVRPHGPLEHARGVFISIVTAYFVMHFLSIMDRQALFSFFIAPLYGTVILGMLWKAPRLLEAFFGLAGWNGFIHRHVGLGEVESRSYCICGAFEPCQRHGADMYRALWSWIVLRCCDGVGQRFSRRQDPRSN